MGNKMMMMMMKQEIKEPKLQKAQHKHTINPGDWAAPGLQSLLQLIRLKQTKQAHTKRIGSVIGISCNALKNTLAPCLEASHNICSREQSSAVSCQHGLVVSTHPYLHNAGL
jgi:hypothetical protein